MKWAWVIVVGLLLLGLIAYIVMAIESHRQPDILGLEHGLLRPCPDSPNCVCSEAQSQPDKQHAIAVLNGNDAIWLAMDRILTELGGVVQRHDDDYMYTTFTTPVFRYVDDVEMRFDRERNVIQVRSASRVGRSDFGVNRKRVQRIRQALP
ncbi:MAG: DUF1499 domain-containing protein [Mariprofundus sp.]|nr:DUF1499 domain-containing protein [Mariprofundus sp.]